MTDIVSAVTKTRGTHTQMKGHAAGDNWKFAAVVCSAIATNITRLRGMTSAACNTTELRDFKHRWGL